MKRWLYPASTGDEINNQHHDGDHEQDMDESAKCISTYQTEQPKNQENNEYCPQHNFPPLKV